jgi:hypothetical protein
MLVIGSLDYEFQHIPARKESYKLGLELTGEIRDVTTSILPNNKHLSQM